MQNNVNCPVNDKVEHESKNYYIHDSYTFVCDVCNIKLAEVVVIKPTEEIKKFMAKCPKCNQKTFLHRFKGQVIIGMTNKCEPSNFVIEKDYTVIETTLRKDNDNG